MRQHEPTAQVHDAGALVEAARERLAAELGRLPAWGSHALWALLRGSGRQPEGGGGVSSGALAHYLRRAAQAGDAAHVRELFVMLLERTEFANRRWAAREAARCGLTAGSAAELREELRQELTLHLWEQLALGRSDAWELFFSRSLDYAQRHTAQAYLQKRGLRARLGVAHPTRAHERLLVSLSHDTQDGRSDAPAPGFAAAFADAVDPFTAAELSDLRALVYALPTSERAAVVMRYWQDASEGEVARGLGVSTRMVRYYLRRAYTRLRAGYTPEEDRDGG